MDAPDISCSEVLSLLTEYLEDALPPASRSRVEQHLAACPPCSDHLQGIRVTIRLTGRITERSLDPRARADLLAAFRGWRDG